MFPLLLALVSGMLPQAVTPNDCWLRDAASVNNGTVFLLCEQGGLLKSKDLREWEAVRIPAPGRVRAVYFLDESRGIVAGDEGLLMITADGGRTWERRPSGTRESLTAIHGAGRKVWAGGYGGVILHSDDAGLTWQFQPTFTTGAIESVYFLDENRGWAAGWSGLFLRTTDGGNSWQQVNVPGLWETLSAIRFRDAQNGWAVGMYGVVLRTRDGGATWQRQPAVTRSWLTSLDFTADGTAWVAAEYHLLRSDDRGETWQVLPHDGATVVTRVIATGDSVLAVGPGFLLTRSGNQSSWRMTQLDELVQPGGLPLREKAGAPSSGGSS
jgi:photosystem II stability/assembly factor-like uncharacterized protein